MRGVFVDPSVVFHVLTAVPTSPDRLVRDPTIRDLRRDNLPLIPLRLLPHTLHLTIFNTSISPLARVKLRLLRFNLQHISRMVFNQLRVLILQLRHLSCEFRVRAPQDCL